MKIIITESQYQKLTEDKLREFLYGFWNNQKKHGEEPSLDDMLYKVLGLNKETREDYDTIRPLWYNYNGGFDKLYNKVKDEIDTKEYNLNQDLFNLDTIIKVVHLETTNNFIEIMVDVDPRGTMDFVGWDEENEEEYEVHDTIDAAYHESLINYESSELMGMIQGAVYEFFYNLLEKYGIPIDVEIDLEEIHDAPYNINESQKKYTRKSDILIDMWDKQTKEDGHPTFDEDILRYFGIDKWTDIYDYAEFFNDYIGGEEKTMEMIDKLSINNFSTRDFPERLVGGYNFDWRIINVYVKDDVYKIDCQVSDGGSVTLMDGRHMSLKDALNDDEVGFEIQAEVSDVIQDCLNSLIYPKTGVKVTVPYVFS